MAADHQATELRRLTVEQEMEKAGEGKSAYVLLGKITGPVFAELTISYSHPQDFPS